jgi:hypothetical protein
MVDAHKRNKKKKSLPSIKGTYSAKKNLPPVVFTKKKIVKAKRASQIWTVNKLQASSAIATITSAATGIAVASLLLSMQNNAIMDQNSALVMKNIQKIYASSSQHEPPVELAQSESILSEKERLAIWKGFLAGSLIKPTALSATTSLYDGRPLSAGTSEIPVAIMIENHGVSRPMHAGISQASMVYEALTEGGITRFMAIYPYQNITRVGPTRSARHYFIEWATEYDPIFVHAGESPMAKHLLWLYSPKKLLNLDEDDNEENGEYTFRDNTYNAPHNLFTNTVEARKEAEQRGFESAAYNPHFCFSNTITADQTSTKIDIIYSQLSDNYDVRFLYNPSTKTYDRYHNVEAPEPHKDTASQQQISPSNIIIQISPWSLIENDEKERIDMPTNGNEKAFFFSNGYAWEGTWEKSSDETSGQQARTIFKDSLGREVCLSPGQTWISIVDNPQLIAANIRGTVTPLDMENKIQPKSLSTETEQKKNEFGIILSPTEIE